MGTTIVTIAGVDSDTGVASSRAHVAEHKRGRLEAQRLAAARGEHEQAVATLEDRVHRLALQWAEVGEAPDAVQRVAQRGVERADYDFLGYRVAT